jgi:hypothetical protein
MRVAIPSASETITSETFFTTTSWFSFFQNVWRAIRGDLGLSLGGMLSVNTTSASNSLAAETDLIIYSLPKNTLTNNNDVLEIDAWGVYAANANNKTVKLYFGSQTLLTTGAIAANDGTWSLRAKIIRKTSTTQEIVSEILSSNGSVSDSATRTAGTQDLTTALTIRCTGQGTSSSDITQYALKINLTPNT